MHSTEDHIDDQHPKLEVTLFYNKEYYLKQMQTTSVTERTRRRSATSPTKKLPHRAIQHETPLSDMPLSTNHIEISENSTPSTKGTKKLGSSDHPYSLRYSTEQSPIVKSLENIRGYHINHQPTHAISEASMKILLSDENWKNDCDLVADYLNKYREFYRTLESRRRQLKKKEDSSDGEKQKSFSEPMLDTSKDIPSSYVV